jgi:pilus assembly protein CpaB
MTREARTGLVVAIAVAVAGLASIGVYRAIQNMPVREVEVGKATMVIAREAMPMGTRLTKDNIKVVRWPSTTPIQGSFDKADALIGRGLVDAVVANEPITSKKVAPKDAGAGLPPAIPPGMRAVSIKVNEVVGVAGFVVPGTRVDVLATVTPDDKQTVSRVVLSDVQVLTAGTRLDQEKAQKDGKPMPVSVVTLMVTPSDAERIALASEKGRLMLALRNPMDAQPTETSGVRMAGLLGSGTAPPPPPTEAKPVVKRAAAPKPAPAPAPVEAAPAPKFYTVEAIRAAKRTEEIVR